MRFITEVDLRDLFKKEPFTVYDSKPNERLTPGGRQFLLDKGIKILSDTQVKKEKYKTDKEKLEKNKENENNKRNENNKGNEETTLSKKIFYSKIKTIESLFLVTAEELLNRDVFLAQQITILGKQFSNIGKDKENQNLINLSIKECEGINAKNLEQDLSDCFEVTEFHIQLEKGKELITLHRLRCTLRELEPLTLQLFGESEFSKEKVGKIRRCISTLSQMICSVLGGKVCQRKS